MKKVPIALDYDPTAQKVAETGFSLAKSMNAEVILLHVIKGSSNYATPGHFPIMGYTGYVDVSHLGDKTIKTLVKEGEVADTILKTAEELHSDIIVLGSHSQKWLENILMGSVTEKVLHDSSIPLFIVPTKKQS